MEEIIRGSEVILVLLQWLKYEDEQKKSSATQLLSKIGLYDEPTEVTEAET
jgi:hypothetical protein